MDRVTLPWSGINSRTEQIGQADYGFREDMSLFTNLFLRAKHWQIFLLLFWDTFLVGDQPLRRFGSSHMVVLGVLTALQTFVFLSWFLFVGSFLCSIVRPTLRPRMRLFSVAAIYPIIYGFAVPKLFQSSDPALSAVILPLHLFAMMCLLYLFYFVSKCLALAESGRPKPFSHFAGTFFLLWFFPIGVWIVQPKVNRLYVANERASLTAS